jgi:hypothetical protein
VDDETLEPLPVDVPDTPLALPETPTPRSRPRALIAGIGIVALAGVGALAISALTGGGGADTPEGAVEQLAAAIGAEDPLAAVDVIAPDEVRTLHDTLDTTARRAAGLDLVESASAPLAGIDLSVEDLELETETLADGYAKVTVRSGELRSTTEQAGFSELVREATADDDVDVTENVDLGDLAPEELDTFLMTVRRDGRWYVSAAYTVLEYVRAANDLPVADFGSGLARAAQLGAESPEAAARDTLDAVASSDWERLLELLPPGEVPLYDYREALSELLDEGGAIFDVTEFDASARIDGDHALVSVRAAGTYDSDGSAEPTEWELSGECLRLTEHDRYDDGFWSDDGFGESVDDALVAPSTTDQVTETSTFAFCLSRPGVIPIAFEAEAGDSPGPVTVRAVQRDGRWFLSPIATALGHVDGWVAGFDRRHLLSLLDMPERIEPDAAIVLGQAVEGTSEGFGLAYTYTLDGRAGQEVVGTTDDGSSGDLVFDGSLQVRVFDPEGDELDDAWGILQGQPVLLPATGTYTVAVVTFTPDDFRFTLWDVDDAPPEALEPSFGFEDEECTFNPDGSIECAFDPTSATTAPTVPTVPGE